MHRPTAQANPAEMEQASGKYAASDIPPSIGMPMPAGGVGAAFAGTDETYKSGGGEV